MPCANRQPFILKCPVIAVVCFALCSFQPAALVAPPSSWMSHSCWPGLCQATTNCLMHSGAWSQEEQQQQAALQQQQQQPQVAGRALRLRAAAALQGQVTWQPCWAAVQAAVPHG